MTNLGKKAQQVKNAIGNAGTIVKDRVLLKIANELVKHTDEILCANEKDIDNGRNSGMAESMLDRLLLTEDRVLAMADGVRQVSMMTDPIGKTLTGFKRPNGLEIQKITVPLGVVAMIYESRPNVTVDAATLCIKSGNAAILRGGKEAINTNIALSEIMRNAIEQAGLPKDIVQLVQDTSRDSATQLMKMNEYVDVLIPRGGANLIKNVVENATVPVIETGTGNCHVYVDESADLEMAVNIIFNGKTTRVSVCNSLESLVIHSKVAEKVLPMIEAKLSEKNVEIRGDKRVLQILPNAAKATDEDFYTEFLDYIISAKIVDSIEEAIYHINEHSTGHSDCIVTESYNASRKFLAEVDSAAVYVNASTRFTDGGEFGEGAEIGISTQKLHARGPMGINQLTTVKFLIFGNGQVR